MTMFIFLQGPTGFAAGDKPPAGQGQGGNAPVGEAPAGGGNQTGTQSSGTPSGNIWDRVPQGGGIRAEKDGSWTIVDKDGNVLANESAAQANSPTPTAGTSWSPDSMKGTIWDRVPEGGSIRAEADGSWTILDRNGNPIGNEKPGQTPPAAEGGSGGTNTAPSTPTPPPQPPLPPPIVTPTPGGGTMTSTPNPDGSWSHHYHREDPDGTVVDYPIRPTDPNYPHDDPRFWKPGEAGGGRVVTPTEGGGTITSTRNADGSWTHRYHRESSEGFVIDYELKPSDDLYPKNDPRFQNPNAPPTPPADPFGGGTGFRPPEGLGPDIHQEQFAQNPEAPHEDHRY